MSIDVITANKAQMGILSSVLRIDPSPSGSSSKSSTDHQLHLGKRSKKIAEKETLVHMGGRGVKKIPFF